MEIKVCKINPDAVIPIRATAGSAGLDFCSLEQKVIYPLCCAVKNTKKYARNYAKLR